MRYLGAGVGAFLLFAAGIPLLAATLVRTNDDPRVFALTHVAVLGWITMTMMGTLYQLFPVALSAEVKSQRLARWTFWVYLAGIVGFVPSFYLAWTPGMAAFGAVTVSAIAYFASGMLWSYRSVRDWHPMAWYVLAALLWLLATIGVGFLYALDWRFHWFAISGNMLAAHVQLGLAGWLSLTLMGVSYKLTAMFSLAHGHDHRLALLNLGLWHAALLGLALSLILVPQGGLPIAFAVALALSAALFVADMALLLRRRRRRRLTIEHWHSFFAFAALLAAAGLGLVLVTGHEPSRNWVVAYGWTAIGGWFGFSIVGKSYKIVPFLTWLHRFSSQTGAGPVPLLRDLLDERLVWLSFGLLGAGFTGVLAGLLMGQAEVVRWTAFGYLMGAGIYGYNILRLALPLLAGRSPKPIAEVLAA